MSRRKAKQQKREVVRCAVYTRQSVSDGKDQDFSSLDAQREACEKFIASQEGRGWKILRSRYDDANLSGATTERPALQRLIEDIEAGMIDCVVVYRIDRLSRSIADFVTLMDRFEQHGVAFTSITQSFDTTNSTGRLTLNLLTCFAQYERETIAERTRDKVHAARRRGKWTGGPPPLGYDVHPDGGRIMVNEAEAEQVREIFNLYLQIETLTGTAEALNRRGWHTKSWTTRAGHERQGKPWTKHTLRSLITNVTYTGHVRLHDDVHEGEHEAIVDSQTFERAQALIARNSPRTGAPRRRRTGSALLAGLLKCGACGSAMVRTHTTKKDRRYEYYVCRTATTKGWQACPTRSINAAEIEQLVVDQIRAIGRDEALLNEVHAAIEAEAPGTDARDLRAVLGRFDPIWDALHLSEKKRLLGQLIEQVAFDREKGTVEFTFKGRAIELLGQEDAA